jgi:hypothetical protein
MLLLLRTVSTVLGVVLMAMAQVMFVSSNFTACDSQCGPGNRTRDVACTYLPTGERLEDSACTLLGHTLPLRRELCQELPRSAWCVGQA